MDKKEEKEQKRVDLSRKETVMANERTYNSWMRSGISSTVGGLFIARFLGTGQKDPILTIIGFIFVLASVWFFILGYWSYKADLERIHGKEARRSVPLSVTLIMTIGLIIGALLSLTLIILFYIF